MRKVFTRAVLLAALTVAAAACGGNDDEGTGTAAPAAPTTAAQAANGATVAIASSSLGDILVDADGRTLYAFTKDKGDQSACSGECATNWPALSGPAWTRARPLPGGVFPVVGVLGMRSEIAAGFPFLSERDAERIQKA